MPPAVALMPSLRHLPKPALVALWAVAALIQEVARGAEGTAPGGGAGGGTEGSRATLASSGWSGTLLDDLVEHRSKRFGLPIFYGLLDGDHDLSSTNDTLACIMMFDQTEPSRFALWNFIKDAAGNPDPHSPAWDWQFVIRAPRVGVDYRYRARLVIKPFNGPDDVLEEYRRWAAALPAAPRP